MKQCKECQGTLIPIVKMIDGKWKSVWTCQVCNNLITRNRPLSKKQKTKIKIRLQKLLAEIEHANEQWLIDNELLIN